MSIYWHVRDTLAAHATATLAEYVRQRSDRESEPFLQAQRNVAFLARRYQDELRRPPSPDIAQAFDRQFERRPDGAYERRRDTFAVNEEASASLAPRVAVDTDAKRRLLAAHRLVTTYGHAWQDTFGNTFLASRDGLLAAYWPGVNWAQEAPELVPFPWALIAARERDPGSGPGWTEIWYDRVGQRWVVTCIQPIEVDGGPRHYAGTSLFLDHIPRRVTALGLEGSYSMIFRADGRLISHPWRFEEIRRTNGEFNVATDGGEDLRAIYRRVLESRGAPVLDLTDRGQYVGVGRIAGPDWYFVTVLAKSAVTGPLRNAAVLVLVVGACALLLELLAFAWIIRRQMSRRLRPVLRATERVAAGSMSVRVPEGDDELGALGRAVNTMAEAVGDRDARLARYADDLKAAVAERTAELEKAVAAADLANRTKSHLLAAASHDLRQPTYALGLLVNALERLAARESVTGRELAGVTAKLGSTFTGLDRLLAAILDISRLDAGAMRPEIGPVDISLILHALVAEFGEACEEKGIALRVVPTTLWGTTDADMLRDMLRNLLSNALRYTVRGKILLGCRRRAGIVDVQVLDTGIGIAPEEHEAIFAEFYQVGNVERDRTKGLGLGLAIVARLSRLLDHPVSLRSALGRGSLFSVRVPRTEAAVQPRNWPRAGSVRHTTGAGVLVIDDDHDVRGALQSALSAWGYRVLLAASVDEALALAAADKEGIACILADYRLPGGATGSDAIRRVEAMLARRCAAFLVTGDTSPDGIREATASGYPVLHKPLVPHQLEALVAAATASAVDAARASAAARQSPEEAGAPERSDARA